MRQAETETTKQAPSTTQDSVGELQESRSVSSAILQRKLQRRALQRRADAQTTGGEAGDGVHRAAEAGVAGGGTSLPHLDSIQRSFGRHDVSGIQAHTGSEAKAASAQIGAEAYATGNHVAFAGSPSLHTAAHEAAHVVQQQSGVSLLGGVGQEGDTYERHADAVADTVVAGKSAEHLLDQHAGGGTASVQRKAVQRLDNAKTAGIADPQVHLNNGTGQAPGVNNGVNAASTQDPFKHPYWPTFLARVEAMFNAIGGPPPKTDPKILARQLWSGILEGMHDAQPQMGDAAAYSNHAAGWANMESPKFQTAMHGFDGIMAHLTNYTSTQFAKAKSFGFWSKPAGKELTEATCDLTLETSGVGALFDGLPSLDGKQSHVTGAKWDAELWAALSNCYAASAANELKRKGTKLHVCIGPKATPGNIFDAIESKAIEKKIQPMGLTLKQVTRFHAAAAKSATENKCDFTVHNGDFKGTAWSGDDLNEARTQATDYCKAH